MTSLNSSSLRASTPSLSHSALSLSTTCGSGPNARLSILQEVIVHLSDWFENLGLPCGQSSGKQQQSTPKSGDGKEDGASSKNERGERDDDIHEKHEKGGSEDKDNIVEGSNASTWRRSKGAGPLEPSPSSNLPSPQSAQPLAPKSKASFQVGSFSCEDEWRADEINTDLRMQTEKRVEFKDEVFPRAIQAKTYESEDVFEDEDDDIDGDWEDDDDTESNMSARIDEKEWFQPVEPPRNQFPRRSLLTKLIHDNPTIRNSRTSSPDGLLGTSPTEGNVPEAFQSQMQASRAKYIITTTSNTHSLALSPRTTRRNMVFGELTESIRKNLLWERQDKKPTLAKSSLTRRYTSNDVKNLKVFMCDTQSGPYFDPRKEASRKANSWNYYFDIDLNAYHETGW